MDLDEAAARLGVHYQTAYRWLRQGTLRAVKVRGAYDVAEAEVARLVRARDAPAPPPERAEIRSWTAQARRLAAAVLAGDERTARTLATTLSARGVPAADIADLLVAPVMAEVGQRWADGAIGIATEHRATAICERLVALLTPLPRGRPRGTAVVATPAGDVHSLPGAMAAAALRDDRWQVHHLGAGVPPEGIVELVRSVDASLVVLSVTMPRRVVSTRAIAAELEPDGRRVLVGAPGAQLRDLVAAARARP